MKSINELFKPPTNSYQSSPPIPVAIDTLAHTFTGRDFDIVLSHTDGTITNGTLSLIGPGYIILGRTPEVATMVLLHNVKAIRFQVFP